MRLEIGKFHAAVDNSNGNSRYPGHLRDPVQYSTVDQKEVNNGEESVDPR